MNKKTVPNSEILKTNYFYIDKRRETLEQHTTKQQCKVITLFPTTADVFFDRNSLSTNCNSKTKPKQNRDKPQTIKIDQIFRKLNLKQFKEFKYPISEQS